MKKHVNIPIFIPHMGCPNQCVFCNQRTISGVYEFNIENVRYEIEEALATIDSNCEVEVAFFGGSFTGIDRDMMISLLKLSYEYIEQGKIKSVRCSTRPDYISQEILDILKKYGVRTIELGLQSTDDYVLSVSKRGHTSFDERIACNLVVQNGFDLIGQMMIGLPGSTLEKEIETARFIIGSGAIGARIYPTIVFYDTELCEMANVGTYKPITHEEAIERAAIILDIFYQNKVDVIRIGLCSSENLSDESKFYKGPNHPALGEMVESRLLYNKIVSYIDRHKDHSDNILTIHVAKGSLSKAIGQKKTNKMKLIRDYGFADIKFKEDENLSGYELKVDEKGKRNVFKIT